MRRVNFLCDISNSPATRQILTQYSVFIKFAGKVRAAGQVVFAPSVGGPDSLKLLPGGDVITRGE
jgi:hypothetical protein